MTQTTIPFSLELIPAGSSLHAPVAWFINGDDPTQWLAEMTAWGVSLDQVKLYVVADPARNRQVSGVLVAGFSQAPRTIAALPYAMLGQKLYFPVDGKFRIDVTAEEADGALRMPVQVMHPSAGLVGFAQEDAISVADLLMPPDRNAVSWDAADPGVHTATRLEAIEAEFPPQLEMILDAARDDIGSEEFDDIPTDPNESPLGDAVREAMRWMIKPILESLAGKPGSTKPGKQEGWLRRSLRKITAASQEHRDREIRRLLSLLSTDPDRGLQYALPLHALISRGIASPSNRLSRHSTDFNLSNVMGGHRPADSWNLAAEMQKELRTKYIESANRELNLGRFQRAAYIFAYLLGDYSSAADALKRGRYFREAAVIYKERLKNMRAAADCLAEGGLLSEAVEIYLELQLFEEAGDLYARVEQTDAATECYLDAARQYERRRSFLSAAKVYENKLKTPDDALQVLQRAWPEYDASGASLLEWFALAGRLGRHDLAQVRIEKLRNEPLPAGATLTLIETLAKTTSVYPNPTVRKRAADGARVLVSRRLLDADQSNRPKLIKALVNLAPDDLLLRRDGARFLEASPQKKPPPLLIPLKNKGPTLLHSFRLPAKCNHWESIIGMTGGVLAVGRFADQLIVARRNWDSGAMNEQTERHAAATGRRPLVLLPPGSKHSVILAELSLNVRYVTPMKLPRLSSFDNDLSVATPAYMEGPIRGACRDEHETVWVLKGASPSNLSLTSYSDDGSVLASYRPAIMPTEEPSLPIPMSARSGIVHIGLGSTVILTRGGALIGQYSLPMPVRSLAFSPLHTTFRMLAAMDRGVAIVWQSGEYQLLGQNLLQPVMTFTPDGLIIIASNDGGQIHKSTASRVEFIANFKLAAQTPIAILPASSGKFAIFYADGSAQYFQQGNL